MARWKKPPTRAASIANATTPSWRSQARREARRLLHPAASPPPRFVAATAVARRKARSRAAAPGPAPSNGTSATKSASAPTASTPCATASNSPSFRSAGLSPRSIPRTFLYPGRVSLRTLRPCVFVILFHAPHPTSFRRGSRRQVLDCVPLVCSAKARCARKEQNDQKTDCSSFVAGLQPRGVRLSFSLMQGARGLLLF